MKELKDFECVVPESDKYGIGKRFVNNQGTPFEIVRKCTEDSDYRYIVFFDDYGVEIRVSVSSICNGSVKNPYEPIVVGVGYIGIGKNKPTEDGKNTRKYQLWADMLRRAYDIKYHERRPTYKDVVVDEKLFDFQYFCQVIENIPFWNEKDENGRYYNLEKDIFSVKRYDENTIVFVPLSINQFLVNNKSNNGNYAVGVCLDKKSSKYITSARSKHLGRFDTELEAYEVYCNARNSYARELAEKYKGKIADRVYNVLINWNEKHWSGYTCKPLVSKIKERVED